MNRRDLLKSLAMLPAAGLVQAETQPHLSADLLAQIAFRQAKQVRRADFWNMHVIKGVISPNELRLLESV